MKKLFKGRVVFFFCRMIEESFPGSVVCINDVRAYVDTDKNIVTDWYVLD